MVFASDIGFIFCCILGIAARPINQRNNTSSTVTASTFASSPSPSADNATDGLDALFPVPHTGAQWTTVNGAPNALPLSDSTFRPKNLIASLSHDYTAAPDGRRSMKAHYPKGSYTYTHSPEGGISFYAPGPAAVDLTTAREATFGYAVYFPEDFDFNLGGKLPGLYGGDDDDRSISCSGGRRDDACFSARLMWREKSGMGEFYTYLPPGSPENDRVCNIPPKSDCNPTYGASIGRGSFSFAKGAWTTIAERVRLNDAGKANGELELFVEGESKIKVTGLVLRNNEAGRIRGIIMQTFFGGNEEVWASPKDQDVYFSQFSVAITSTL
ncbi:hypothetical protein C8R43DRAFT_127191 [Mycena crocata]|nr:hypothetical protein C8R43DRAFT_127191 [Mycena crocata]